MRFRKPLLVGLLGLGYLVNLLLLGSLLRLGQFGYDAYAYWSVDPSHPYATTPTQLAAFGAFHYAPPIAQLFSVFHVLPWWLFVWGWTALLVATLIWLGGRWTLFLLAFPPVILELYAGNVNLLVAAAIALGFRYPVTWGFVLLTEVTPGIGVLWFAFRREWARLAVALGITIAASVVSFALAPDLAGRWGAALQDNLRVPTDGSVPVPLALRLVIAAALMWWGSRRDRKWTVPVAATISIPVLWIGWSAWLVVLLGALPLLKESDALASRASVGHETPVVSAPSLG